MGKKLLLLKNIFSIKFLYSFTCHRGQGHLSMNSSLVNFHLWWTCAFFTQCIMEVFYFNCFSVWVLVLFKSEEVLSHPLPLGEVQDLSGRNGEETNLQEREYCLAQYYVGDKMRKAIIFKRSGEMVMWLS